MTLDDFGRLFTGFARSAFRVEALDRYDVPAERDEFAAFRAGARLHRRSPGQDGWLAFVASAAASGRTVDRVRLVTRPITQYTRYEFACYPSNIAAGEAVGIVERRWLQPEDQRWAGEDFWIFDDEIVVLLDYDKQGRFLGAAQAEQIDSYLVAQATSDLAIGRLQPIPQLTLLDATPTGTARGSEAPCARRWSRR